MTTEEHEYWESRFTKVDTSLTDISRGLYGDTRNRIPGILDRVNDHEDRISIIEEIKKKILFWLGGATAVTVVFVEIFHWITH